MATTCSTGRKKDLRLNNLCIKGTEVITSDRNVVNAKSISTEELCINRFIANETIFRSDNVLFKQDIISNSEIIIENLSLVKKIFSKYGNGFEVGKIKFGNGMVTFNEASSDFNQNNNLIVNGQLEKIPNNTCSNVTAFGFEALDDRYPSTDNLRNIVAIGKRAMTDMGSDLQKILTIGNYSSYLCNRTDNNVVIGHKGRAVRSNPLYFGYFNPAFNQTRGRYQIGIGHRTGCGPEGYAYNSLVLGHAAKYPLDLYNSRSICTSTDIGNRKQDFNQSYFAYAGVLIGNDTGSFADYYAFGESVMIGFKAAEGNPILNYSPTNYSVAVGAFALQKGAANALNSRNTAIGSHSLRCNVGRNYFGPFGSGNDRRYLETIENTCVGFRSMNGVTDGIKNTVLGAFSQINNTYELIKCTIIGAHANASGNTTNSVLIGYNSGGTQVPHSFSTVVGANSYAENGNNIVLGCDSHVKANDLNMSSDTERNVIAGSQSVIEEQLTNQATKNLILGTNNIVGNTGCLILGHNQEAYERGELRIGDSAHPVKISSSANSITKYWVVFIRNKKYLIPLRPL